MNSLIDINEGVAAQRVQAFPGQMGGYVADPSGAVVVNSRVTITNSATGGASTAMTDSQGRWVIAGLPSGNYKARAEAPGFKANAFNLNYDAERPSMYNFTLEIGSVSETIEVNAEAPQLQTEMSSIRGAWSRRDKNLPSNGKLPSELNGQSGASANVMNLQKRVAGVLPVAIDVPRAGTSFSFVRPLVLDEETKVTFSYKSR